MNREEKERIMEAACEICHWPYVYQDSEIMNDEKCKYDKSKRPWRYSIEIEEEKRAEEGET